MAERQSLQGITKLSNSVESLVNNLLTLTRTAMSDAAATSHRKLQNSEKEHGKFSLPFDVR